MHTRSIFLLATAGLLLGACADRSSSRHSQDLAEMPSSGTADAVAQAPPVLSRTATPSPPTEGRELDMPESVADTTVPAPGQPGAPTAGQTVAIPTLIIRTGTATLQVDSLERAVAQVKALAAQLGGYIATSSESTGSQNVRSASLEVKLPAAQWDRALAGLRPVGKLESQQATAEDVGEEFVDVTARVANSRRLEERLISLLATRTGKLDDVLAVERELARVREEIERYEGRLRYLRSRISLSTLTVTLHEPYPTLAPGNNPIVDAFRSAWRNFVGFVAGLIAALGWLVPLLAVIAALVWLFRKLFRGRPGGFHLGRRGEKGPRDATRPPPPPRGPATS